MRIGNGEYRRFEDAHVWMDLMMSCFWDDFMSSRVYLMNTNAEFGNYVLGASSI